LKERGFYSVFLYSFLFLTIFCISKYFLDLFALFLSIFIPQGGPAGADDCPTAHRQAEGRGRGLYFVMDG